LGHGRGVMDRVVKRLAVRRWEADVEDAMQR
jgi:hypothetical protein